MSNDVDMVTIELNGERMNFLLGKKDFKTGSAVIMHKVK